MKTLFFTSIIIILMSCVSKKDFLEVNNVWMLISEDSVYYEFYFDDYQQFYFDGRYENGFCFQKLDTSSFRQLILDMTTNLGNKEDSVTIYNYFSENVVKNTSFIDVKPIGSYLYRFSNDVHLNYILFSTEAYKRYRIFLGAETDYLPFPFDTSMFYEEEVLIPMEDIFSEDTSVNKSRSFENYKSIRK